MTNFNSTDLHITSDLAWKKLSEQREKEIADRANKIIAKISKKYASKGQFFATVTLFFGNYENCHSIKWELERRGFEVELLKGGRKMTISW